MLDTGPLVAAINRRDPDHERCRKLLEERAGSIVTTPYVIGEVCYMAASRIGAEAEANVIDAVLSGDFRQVSDRGA
ncbi:type II toxin-antitoxin system VapC family toxin [Sphaerisporangium aureirubrum]|uniref:Type II toxin-antitoxin system VapC family toxin n=1 Tax=Sphaerisporangium aureirubrum TaxID=1544736 RepID=A0ABW1NHD1_9ACTN